MNLKELKEIFRLVEKTDFSEVEVVHGDFRVRIGRGSIDIQRPTVYAPQIAQPRNAEDKSPEVLKPLETVKEEKGVYVTSPFVGTFYRSPAPDTESYAQVGQVVKKGQILCIVEAMKLMNEIESDIDGKVVEIYPENAQAVEFGEKLFRIEPL